MKNNKLKKKKKEDLQSFEEQVRLVKLDEPEHELNLSAHIKIQALEVLAASIVHYFQTLQVINKKIIIC